MVLNWYWSHKHYTFAKCFFTVHLLDAKVSSVWAVHENGTTTLWFPVCVCMSSTVSSSKRAEALQPPISEEAVCLVGRILVVTSS